VKILFWKLTLFKRKTPQEPVKTEHTGYTIPKYDDTMILHPELNDDDIDTMIELVGNAPDNNTSEPTSSASGADDMRLLLTLLDILGGVR
jgi:hypothetical protein